MDDQIDSCFVGHRTNFAEEVDQVAAQTLGVDALVAVEFMLELVERKRLFRARQSGNHRAREGVDLVIVHLLEACLGLADVFGCIIMLGTWTLEDEEVECHEGCHLEHQAMATVLEDIVEVGACPIEHRHKVVGHHVDATGSEVTDALLVVVDIQLEVAFLRLDMLVYGHALDACPRKACCLDGILAFHDFLHGPYLAVGDMVECGDDAGGSCLTNITKADGIVGSVPAHGLFTKMYHRVESVKWRIHQSRHLRLRGHR